MELRQIQYILQLFKDGNITKASHKLFISQQGLSKSINRMEDELGFKLFDRSTSGVIPTEKGLALYPYFERISSSFEDLEKAIEEFRKDHTLRVAGYHGFALTQGGFYPRFHQLHPEAGLRYEELSNEMIADHLQDRKADLAFLLGPVPADLVSYQLTRSDPVCAVMNRSHPLALNSRLTPEELKGHKLLLLKEFHHFNDLILSVTETMGGPCTVYGHAGAGEFLPLLQSLDLTGFCTREMYAQISLSDLVFIPVEDGDGSRLMAETHLVSLRDPAPGEEARQFIDYIISEEKSTT